MTVLRQDVVIAASTPAVLALAAVTFDGVPATDVVVAADGTSLTASAASLAA